MTVTEQEIARIAAQRSAARRRRVTKACEICGTTFEGLTTKRYCSDRCRMQAARERSNQIGPAGDRSVLAEQGLEPLAGESAVDHLARIRAVLMGDRVFTDDSTEIVRQSRIERTNDLMEALGWNDLVEEQHDEP